MFISFNKVSTLGQKKVELFKKLLQSSFDKNETRTVDQVIADFSSNEEYHLIAKLAGNSLAGIAGFRLDGTEAIIFYIAVAKKYARNGYGRQLVNHISTQNSVQRIYLECNVESAPFFEKVGFKVIEQFKDQHDEKRFRLERKSPKQSYF